MNRNVHKSASIAVNELNRLEDARQGGRTSPSYEHLMDIRMSLYLLAIEGDVVGEELPALAGEKPERSTKQAMNGIANRLYVSGPALQTIAQRLRGLARDTRSYAAGQAMIGMAAQGQFKSLRRCSRCNRWFAGRTNRKFCSASCRSIRWQAGSGRDRQRVAHRRWWLTKIGLPQVKFKLKALPANRPLTRREEARKQGYLAKEARYRDEITQLEKLKPEANWKRGTSHAKTA